MSFDALIQGKLRGGVTVKQSKNGNPYSTFRLSTTDKKGDGLSVSCITFNDTVIDVIRAMQDGDTIAVSGEAAISSWTGNDGAPRFGLDLTVHTAMTAYHAGRKRDAAAKAKDANGTERTMRQQSGGYVDDFHGDDWHQGGAR